MKEKIAAAFLISLTSSCSVPRCSKDLFLWANHQSLCKCQTFFFFKLKCTSIILVPQKQQPKQRQATEEEERGEKIPKIVLHEKSQF